MYTSPCYILGDMLFDILIKMGIVLYLNQAETMVEMFGKNGIHIYNELSKYLDMH